MKNFSNGSIEIKVQPRSLLHIGIGLRYKRNREEVCVMKQISEIRKFVSKRAEEYGAERVYLSGSYARGEATENRDIDLHIDKGRIRGGIALSGLLLDLKSDLGANIDLVTTGSLDTEFLEMIKGE